MLEPKDIRDLRKALGLTAKEFGEKCGVTWNTVFRWESGERFASRRHQSILNEMRREAESKGLLQVA